MSLREAEFQINALKANITRYGYQLSPIGRSTGIKQERKFDQKLKIHTTKVVSGGN